MQRLSRLFTPAVAAALGLGVWGLFGACTAPSVETPLFDSLNPPLILHESAAVDWPASNAPNRFIKSWWDTARRGQPRLLALEGARIQGVKLGSAGKALRLVSVGRPAEGASLEARVPDANGSDFPWRNESGSRSRRTSHRVVSRST